MAILKKKFTKDLQVLKEIFCGDEVEYSLVADPLQRKSFGIGNNLCPLIKIIGLS